MDKKEIKKQYKETVQPMGIFQIKNMQSGKLFIGSAMNIHGRINRIKEWGISEQGNTEGL